MSGPSGEIGYPYYLEQTHGNLLVGGNVRGVSDPYDPIAPDVGAEWSTTYLVEVLNGLLDLESPWVNAVAHDSDTELAEVEVDVESFATYAGSFEELIEFPLLLEVAVTGAGELPNLDATAQGIQVAAFSASMMLELGKAHNRLAAGFSDINATMSTAFPGALAIMESEHARNIAKFAADVSLNASNQEVQATTQFLQQIVQLLSMKQDLKIKLPQLRENQIGNRANTKNQQTATDAEYLSQDMTWQLNVMQEAGNVIGATSGIPGMARGMTAGQREMKDAAIGAQVALSGISAMTSGLGGIMGMLL